MSYLLVHSFRQELGVDERADAVSSLVYEANARVRDPVYGCVGTISYLQNQVSQLQMQLAMAQAEIFCLQMQQKQQDHQSSSIANSTPHVDLIEAADDHSFLQNNFPYYNHYLNFASNSSTTSSSSNNVIIHDSLKRESLFGHDMVS